MNFFRSRENKASSDLERLEALKPLILKFETLLDEAEATEDSENLKRKMIDIENSFGVLCREIKKTIHGAQYFREKDSINMDSLETAQGMLVYMNTPLENFHRLENRLAVLNKRVENSSRVIFSE